MKHDDDLVSQGSPPEQAPATSGGAASLTAAMNAVLKAVKPLEALVKAQEVAVARRQACMDTFRPLCALPETEDRALIERFVQAAEVAYLVWFDACEAANAAKRALKAAELEFDKAHRELYAACDAATKDETLKDDKTLAASKHMLLLTSRHRSRVDGEVRDAIERADIMPEDEEELARLRAAAVDFLLTESVVKARHKALEPLVLEAYNGTGLGRVPLPVRPIEEEIVRYLSNLENNLQRRQELNRQVVPLLKERLALLGKFSGWLDTWKEATAKATAESNPRRVALYPYVQALKEIVDHVRQYSANSEFENWYYYQCGFATDPDILETHDRPKSTAVERDQIDYLRKQMRAVAFAVAHREEAKYAVRKFKSVEKSVTPQGVADCGNWAECLEWFEQLRKRRDTVELENLSNTTKYELLTASVEHWEGKVIDEMTTLYKSFQAMIPRSGPKPSNELRKLLEQAEHMCVPLDPSYRGR